MPLGVCVSMYWVSFRKYDKDGKTQHRKCWGGGGGGSNDRIAHATCHLGGSGALPPPLKIYGL